MKFFRITIPLLSPVIFFNLVMQLISGFMVFTQGLIIAFFTAIVFRTSSGWVFYDSQEES